MKISKTAKVILILLAIVALALIRMFQANLFYDPFIEFFKSNYTNSPPPEFNTLKLFMHSTMRYALNTIISLFTIWIAFPQKSVLKFSILFYAFAFIVLLSIQLIIIQDLSPTWYSTFFYVRRFLIQPVFLIILLPAFYYQNQAQKE